MQVGNVAKVAKLKIHVNLSRLGLIVTGGCNSNRNQQCLIKKQSITGLPVIRTDELRN